MERLMEMVTTRLVALGLVLVVSGAACAGMERPPAAGAAAPVPAAKEAAPAPTGTPAPAATGARTCAAEAAPPEPVGDDPIAQALRHYIRGRLYMADQQNLLAVQELQAAAALAPDVHHIRLYLGLALHDTGSVSAAIESLDAALRLAPADAETLYYRARVSAGQGDAKAARGFLDRLLAAAAKKSPYRILGLYYSAKVHQELGNTAAAIGDYEALIAVLNEPEAYFQKYPEVFLIYRNQVQVKEMLGRLYLVSGDTDKAIQVLEEVLEERPAHGDTLALVCRAYIQKKDYAHAREFARKLIDLQGEGATGYQLLAEIFTAEGNPKGVVPELEAFRRDHPQNRILAFQLASAYEAAGRKGEAAALYHELSTASEANPGTSAAATLKLAELYVQENRPVDALEVLADSMKGELVESAILIRAARLIDSLSDRARAYQEAQRLVTDDNKNYGRFVLVGMLAESLGRRDEALALYEKALARQPKAAIAISRKADLLIDAGRSPDALAVYRAAIQAGLDLPAFHRKMGMILESMGRFDEALAEYRAARQGAPDDRPTRYLLAAMLGRLGQVDEAEKELKGLLARFPGDVQAYCQLAGIYLVRGNMEDAERVVGQAQAIDPAAVTPRSLLAEIRFRQGRLDDAERLARAILTERPGQTDVRLLLAYVLAGQRRAKDAAGEMRALLAAEPENIGWRYFLAGLYTEMGDTAAAEQELQRILQKKPDHAPSNNDLGYMWADRGVNLPQAENMIRAALKAEPQSAAYLDSLGWVMYKGGRFEEAVKALQQATEKAPELDAILWDHLGDAYWRLSRPQDAAKAWQTAAKILESRSKEAKAADLERVQQKVRSAEAGAAPAVAPVAVAEPPAQSLRKP